MKSRPRKRERRGSSMPSWREVFLYFLFLGFVNIGGPIAQITMMFNHMVEKRRWLSKDRFVKIMAFCHMLPGPEALQLAIYVGYLKRKVLGGILAGLTFILPGAVVMIVLSWLYVRYGQLPQVLNALYVLNLPSSVSSPPESSNSVAPQFGIFFWHSYSSAHSWECVSPESISC